ncbi:high frequency lysogenization protein HflD [Halopseudomonas phragmitis]|uniref:High frequency lysogenization protein HflD homolog n=2 Tax=Pseudomonadaceae TaxID=135621 RepID=A0A1V0B7A3_9GAMM|nr:MULTISPECIES: high frequency lysogenization protein HflD [Pseudomonadaceae]AQZ95805.1 lysogenization regulator HflD [Halopseudomonas phragmitis]PAU88709.1 lysogenization regulator HflD [Pseudomonas sp. WN033]RHW21454.1 lysogenization regulator HflD [Pseudomonas jilinensis]
MTRYEELAVALGAVFETAILVDKLARSGQLAEGPAACLVRSILERSPDDVMGVYGGSHHQIRQGLQALESMLARDNAALQRDALRYTMNLLVLERQLNKRDDMLQVLGQRLQQAESQVEHFGALHDNVWASLGSIYQDTISTLKLRIQVHGDMRYLQQPDIANRIRALLLAGIRSARLWRQLGGHRWHLLFYRKRLLEAVRAVLND